jgi:hypothetical protein
VVLSFVNAVVEVSAVPQYIVGTPQKNGRRGEQLIMVGTATKSHAGFALNPPQAQKVALWDALKLQDCNNTEPAPPRGVPPPPPPMYPMPASSVPLIFVDYAAGSDAAAGTKVCLWLWLWLSVVMFSPR